ncbi:MAG: diacylglycerol kinase family protein [Bacilli bacterium]
MKHLFIINPAAGKKDQSRTIIELIQKLDNFQDMEIYLTKGVNDGKDYVHQFCQNHPNEQLRIYSCGGDGTLNEVVNGAYGFSNVEIACYPSGSGNDFVKYFGEIKDFLSFEHLINGTAIDVDLIRFNNRYAINIFNLGFDADVVVRMQKYKRWPLMSGKGSYIMGVLVTFLNKMGYHFSLTVDDQLLYSGEGLLCAVANSICYGGGFYCAPKAKIDDGIIDIVLVKKISRFSFISMINTYKAGRHLEVPRVAKNIIYGQGKKVVISCKELINFSIDGEMGKADSLSLEVVPKAIKFIIPNFLKEKLK